MSQSVRRSVMQPHGITLIELLIVLFVLGLISGMSVLAIGRLRRPATSQRSAVWRRARATALRSGQPTQVTGDNGTAIRFLPDGRAIGDGVDPFTGDVFDASK